MATLKRMESSSEWSRELSIISWAIPYLLWWISSLAMSCIYLLAVRQWGGQLCLSRKDIEGVFGTQLAVQGQFLSELLNQHVTTWVMEAALATLHRYKIYWQQRENSTPPHLAPWIQMHSIGKELQRLLVHPFSWKIKQNLSGIQPKNA
jgi:hypothetical protein